MNKKEHEMVNRSRQDMRGEAAVIDLLTVMGQDTTKEGLINTPKRHVKFLREFCNPPQFEFTTFDSEGNDNMVIVHDIPFYSICEHHLIPFFGIAHIAYIPNGKIVGLSKIPRLLDQIARKPQNQERITNQIAIEMMALLSPKGIGVILKARHLCVEMRGVEKPGTYTTTSAMLGVFKDDVNCRQEFLNLIK